MEGRRQEATGSIGSGCCPVMSPRHQGRPAGHLRGDKAARHRQGRQAWGGIDPEGSRLPSPGQRPGSLPSKEPAGTGRDLSPRSRRMKGSAWFLRFLLAPGPSAQRIGAARTRLRENRLARPARLRGRGRGKEPPSARVRTDPLCAVAGSRSRVRVRGNAFSCLPRTAPLTAQPDSDWREAGSP